MTAYLSTFQTLRLVLAAARQQQEGFLTGGVRDFFWFGLIVLIISGICGFALGVYIGLGFMAIAILVALVVPGSW